MIVTHFLVIVASRPHVSNQGAQETEGDRPTARYSLARAWIFGVRVLASSMAAEGPVKRKPQGRGNDPAREAEGRPGLLNGTDALVLARRLRARPLVQLDELHPQSLCASCARLGS
jgi:hypothetical protein